MGFDMFSNAQILRDSCRHLHSPETRARVIVIIIIAEIYLSVELTARSSQLAVRPCDHY